jgi:hypothetical protein
MLSPRDLDKISAKGIGQSVIERQLGNFIHGFPPVCLSRVATAGDGIFSFNNTQKKFYRNYFEQNAGPLRIMKFVPASGAATRMFKSLFEFRHAWIGNPGLSVKDIKEQGYTSAFQFFSHLEKFAFFDDLDHTVKKTGKDLLALRSEGEFIRIIDHLLYGHGLNYSNLPKALLKFHRYPEGARVALEEHLVEAANYARDGENIANLHFTLSPEHLKLFHDKVESSRKLFEQVFNIRYQVEFSIQKPSTDTIAVDMNNVPMHDEDGSLLFRPAGHGALIENLNEINADIIFIKNIDNVVPDTFKKPTFEYKKLIGGYLLKVRDQIFKFLKEIEQQKISHDEIDRMAAFAREELLICLPPEFHLFSPEKKVMILGQKLNRPIRVCGMVKNEGEPGGGPFWVKDSLGNISLQIVESSQVNMQDLLQEKIVNSSTHFNPVDIVCSIKNWRGDTFKLSDYVDDSTGFISIKSSGGKSLKALELPGLWNGAMADWITIFIEVPVSTFNPVKVINDLLRKEHQS